MLRGGVPGSGREKLLALDYDGAPFDITRERLPRAYGGHNARLIAGSIETIMAKQAGGAEGDAPYPSTGLAGDTPTTGTLTLGSVYAFMVKPDAYAYKKHEQVMQVSCDLWRILAKGTAGNSLAGFRVDYIPQVDNSYTTTDASGAKIVIEEVKFREYTIAFDNLGDFPAEVVALPAVAKGKGNHPVDPDDALLKGGMRAAVSTAKVKPDELERNMRLLVVCRLAQPYVTSESIHEVGSPERPREYLAQHEYLHVRLLELWFYDAATGEVLTKIMPGQNPKAHQAAPAA